MAVEGSTPDPGETSRPEDYPIGYEAKTVDHLSSRRAAHQAAFLLPYLGSGLSLLDCGCGPGTITADLAEIVAPGEVVGIDIEPSQIESARAYAAGRRIANIRFQVADVYDLPFSADSFDAVFLHGVVEHLREPDRALRELRRVLRPAGVLAMRNVAVSSTLIDPGGTAVRRLWDLYSQLCRQDGGDPEFGRSQLGALHAAGFKRIRSSASCDHWTETPEQATLSGSFLASWLREGSGGSQAVALGLADRTWLESTASAIEAWAARPDAFLVEVWCEAVAWKD